MTGFLADLRRWFDDETTRKIFAAIGALIVVSAVRGVDRAHIRLYDVEERLNRLEDRHARP